MGKVWFMYDELGVKLLIVGYNIGFVLRNRIYFLGGGDIREYFIVIFYKNCYFCVLCVICF